MIIIDSNNDSVIINILLLSILVKLIIQKYQVIFDKEFKNRSVSLKIAAKTTVFVVLLKNVATHAAFFNKITNTWFGLNRNLN